MEEKTEKPANIEEEKDAILKEALLARDRLRNALDALVKYSLECQAFQLTDPKQDLGVELWRNGLLPFRGSTWKQFLAYCNTIMRRRRTRSEKNTSQSGIPSLFDEREDPNPSPSDNAITNEEKATELHWYFVFQSSMGAISESDQLLLRLRDGERKPFSEMGRILGKVEETVKREYRRAKTRLGEECKQRGLAPPPS